MHTYTHIDTRPPPSPGVDTVSRRQIWKTIERVFRVCVMCVRVRVRSVLLYVLLYVL